MASTASEGKAESKPKAKAVVKEKEAEENQEILKYKTWVLRVSIHCEGCKKKVKKILTNIGGVYTTDIDLRQQKVIVTGDVDAETLIRKLEKNGKHAGLWPESKAEQNEKKPSKSKNKGKQQQQQQSDQESPEEGNNNPSAKETVKIEVTVKESSKNKENENGGTSKNVETSGNEVGSTSKAGGKVNESKPEVKQTVTVPAGSQSPVGDKKVGGGESEGAVEKSGGTGSGSGGKKKKNKGHKGSNGSGNVVIGEGEPSVDAPAGTGSPIHEPNGPSQDPYPSQASFIPPRQHGYQYPQYPPAPHYYTPPVYAVSYNTAYPRPSYSESYYAAPAPDSYAYMHSGMRNENPPSDVDSYSSPPSDSFEIFSDENPNACSIM